MSIYVGNLSYDVTEDDIREVFAEYGTVNKVTLPKDRETGRVLGFAFVEMPHGREAVKAIKGLNTLRLHGTGIRVKQAEEKPQA